MPELRDPIALVRHVATIGDIPLLELIVRRLSPCGRTGPGTEAFTALARALELVPLAADDRRDA